MHLLFENNYAEDFFFFFFFSLFAPKCASLESKFTRTIIQVIVCRFRRALFSLSLFTFGRGGGGGRVRREPGGWGGVRNSLCFIFASVPWLKTSFDD